MLIDCNDCVMQDTSACDECVVSHVLHDISRPLSLGETEAGVLELLADEGLVPELRLIPKSAGG
jgi:hypothetical protein